jgi:hypothetical protein
MKVQFKPLGSDRIGGRAAPSCGVRAANDLCSALSAGSLNDRHSRPTIAGPKLLTAPSRQLRDQW